MPMANNRAYAERRKAGRARHMLAEFWRRLLGSPQAFHDKYPWYARGLLPCDWCDRRIRTLTGYCPDDHDPSFFICSGCYWSQPDRASLDWVVARRTVALVIEREDGRAFLLPPGTSTPGSLSDGPVHLTADRFVSWLVRTRCGLELGGYMHTRSGWRLTMTEDALVGMRRCEECFEGVEP